VKRKHEFRLIDFAAAVVLVACWTWAAWGGVTQPPPDRARLQPPKPNPAAPVDYIAWLNGTNGCLQENAFDAYIKAYKRLARFEDKWGKTLTQPWSDSPAVAAWLRANQEGLALFRRAAGRSDFCFRLSRNREFVEPRALALLLAWEKPVWRSHLDASMGLLAAGWRAWLAGNEELLLENAMVVLRAAHHLQAVPWPIARLFGDGAAVPAYRALLCGFAKAQDPAKWAARLAVALERDDPPAPPFGYACSRLRFEFWDLCQRVFLPGGSEGLWPVHRGMIQALIPRLEGKSEDLIKRLESIGLAASLRESDAYYDSLERWNGLPYYLAAEKPFPLDALLRASINPLVQLQAGLTLETRAKIERTIALRRATHLVMYLWLYRARFGTFPDRLGQMIVPDLETLRRDPFSGEDFAYRRDGNDFLFYSVAYNLSDDGGQHDPEWKSGDYVFWPVRD
jgi:hypothetical protein